MPWVAAIGQRNEGALAILAGVRELLASRLELDPVVRERFQAKVAALVEGMKHLAPNQREIAEQLVLSPNTVSTYRARILEKTGWRNNTELTKYCVQHGLTDAA